MAARDLITLDEPEVHISGLDHRRKVAEGRMDTLKGTSERVDRLRLMQRNPILLLVAQAEDMRRDHYDDLELRVEIEKGDVKICGVFGSQFVAPTSTTGTRR